MKILLPVNFSVVSTNAIAYAFQLYPKAEFLITNVSSGVISTREPFYLKEGKTKVMVLKEELDNEIKEALGTSDLPANIKSEVSIGEIIPALKKLAIEFEPDLIIMGTRDNYDLVDKVFGTVSLRVTKSGIANTLLIPRYAKYEGIKKVVIATDHHIEDSLLLDWILAWNKEQKAKLHFLHIQDKNNDEMESITKSITEKILNDREIDFEFTIEKIQNKDVGQTLLSKAYNVGADMVIAAPDRQSLLNSILIKSISKELILKSKIPIFFLSNFGI